jgi:hypothetical protein
MGLHSDVKPYLRERFSKSVNDAIPQESCDVLICDHMWILFKFFPDDDSTGEHLVDFIWKPIERFFNAGGTTFVCVFDIPGLVPIAKAEEHKKRYGSRKDTDTVERITPTGKCSQTTLPLPWSAALADRKTRADICQYIADGIARRFAQCHTLLKGKELFVSGVGDTVAKITVQNEIFSKEASTKHAAAALIGEGDLSVAYWAQQFHDRTVIARVLDSDQIPILMLRAHIARRSQKLYVWLVGPRRDETLKFHGYEGLPYEKHTLIDIISLNQEIGNCGIALEEYVYWIIAQKTDFVDKIVQNLGVGATLAALEKNPSRGITVNASGAKCHANRVKKSFELAAIHGKRKRAEIRQNGAIEFRRAWWTLLYWSYGWDGPLRDALRPTPAFGFDRLGMRTAAGINEPFPAYVCKPLV